MATKIDIEDLQLILSAKEVGIPADKQTLILEELIALSEQQKTREDKKVKSKNKFLVLPIVQNEEELTLFAERSYIVLQVPEAISGEETLQLIENKMHEVAVSKKGKKNGLNTASVAIGKIPAKQLVFSNGTKARIKTKMPVEGIPVINNLN